MSVKPLHVAPGEGVTFHVLGGDQITIKAGGDDTGGALAVCETVTPPQAGPPPHLHQREDESFYVLEGEFEFYVGSEVISASAGSYVLAPRNIPHRFRNVGETPGRLLIVCQPAGFEKFVEDFAELPPDEPPDMATMTAIGERHGIVFLQDTSGSS